jgi:hypothetical protein
MFYKGSGDAREIPFGFARRFGKTGQAIAPW